jgi:hypothetical protein
MRRHVSTHRVSSALRRSIAGMLLLPAVALLPVLSLPSSAEATAIVAPYDPNGVVWGDLTATGTVLFNTLNLAAVSPSPTVPAAFSTTATYTIVSIATYHWQDGRTPGSIGLEGTAGTSLGSWVAQGDNHNYYWYVRPNVTIGPGTYTVIDSSPSTWSYNLLGLSSGMGFTRVLVGESPAPVYTLTPSAGAGGSILPTTPQTVNAGDDSTFTITASAGYHIADVKIDGASVGAVASYTFKDVAANHTIQASFAANASKLPTSLTIATNLTSVVRGKQFILSGLMTPTPGTVGVMIHVDVKKPGRGYYSYSSNRVVYAGVGGKASWQYKYNSLKTQAKGTYVFKAVWGGNGAYLSCQSGTKSVTFK